MGKSLLTAGLLRHFRRLGLKVAPFKAQNMSNHARVVAGGEMASAQWLQALAAGVRPEPRMNPVLIKPMGRQGAQVVLLGQVNEDLADAIEQHLDLKPLHRSLGLMGPSQTQGGHPGRAPGQPPPPGLTLLLGGARSGKSRLAQRLAGPFATLVATAEPRDQEMEARIARHRAQRPPTWETIEEPLNLVEALGRARHPTVVVDYLTLWVANLMEKGLDPLAEAKRFLEAVDASGKRVIAVSNEVGMGIVPVNPLARRYRDLLGEVNALLAARAKEAFFVVAGRTLRL